MLHIALDHEVDVNGNEVIIGDGFRRESQKEETRKNGKKCWQNLSVLLLTSAVISISNDCYAVLSFRPKEGSISNQPQQGLKEFLQISQDFLQTA